MSALRRRLVAGVIVAGTATIALPTAVASAAPASVTAEKCGAPVEGRIGWKVLLTPDQTIDTAVTASANGAAKETKADENVVAGLVGTVRELVDGLLTGEEKIELADRPFVVGKIEKGVSEIPQSAIVTAIVGELRPSFGGDEEFEQRFTEQLSANLSCSVPVTVLTPKPEPQPEPEQPDGPGGDGGGRPEGPSPTPPVRDVGPTAPPQGSLITAPPATSAPDAPSLPPSLAPDAPPQAMPGSESFFESAFPDGAGVPGSPTPVPGAAEKRDAPVGNATALAEQSTSETRDSLGFGMLAGVLAASVASAGLVRAVAARRSRR